MTTYFYFKNFKIKKIYFGLTKKGYQYIRLIPEDKKLWKYKFYIFENHYKLWKELTINNSELYQISGIIVKNKANCYCSVHRIKINNINYFWNEGVEDVIWKNL